MGYISRFIQEYVICFIIGTIAFFIATSGVYVFKLITGNVDGFKIFVFVMCIIVIPFIGFCIRIVTKIVARVRSKYNV